MCPGNCGRCGKPIVGKGKRFCSRACFRAERRATARRTLCRNCGREFRPRGGSKRSLFCSRGCFEAHRRAHPKEYWTSLRVRVRCEGCGREFEKKRSQLRVSEHHFCSRACANRAHSRALKEDSARYQAGRAAIVCRGCGKTFHASPHRAAKARFCSKACLFLHRFSPQGGDAPGAPGAFISNNLTTARENARQFLGRKCLVCGFDACVETHHILSRRDRGTNRIENLIVLCPNHHKMAHLGLIAPEELRRITLAAIARSGGTP